MRTKELEAALSYLEEQKRMAGFGQLNSDRHIDILAAEVRRLEADKRRLDWLADRENSIGQVLLPTACVQAHLDDLRAAIDAAMEDQK